MPELGIGQAQGMASRQRCAHCLYPTDVEASLRWFRDDIIAPFLEVKDGFSILRRSAWGSRFESETAKLKEYAVVEHEPHTQILSARAWPPDSRTAKDRLIIDTHLEVWTLDPKFPFAHPERPDLNGADGGADREPSRADEGFRPEVCGADQSALTSAGTTRTSATACTSIRSCSSRTA